MKIGIVFPQTEFGNDPKAIHDYAQTVEDLGFSHILAYDHVLGANPVRSGGWQGPYTEKDPFHEPFVLFSFMTAVTQKIDFHNRRHHITPTPNGSGRQTSCNPRCPERRTSATGVWHRLEPDRIYSAK